MRYIIIVNYNSADVLADCIASIAHEDAHIVVVENESTREHEYERCEALLVSIPQHTLIRAGSNLGFGAGVNLGIAHVAPTDDDTIWVLNPDTVVPSGAYVRLQQSMLTLGDCIVSPVILSGENSESVWFAGGRIDRKRGETTHLTVRPAPSSAPAQCTFLTGAAIMFKGSVWRRLGGFREDLFLYWEDADLSLRASAAGIKLFVVPDVDIWHHVGASSGRNGKSATWYYFLSRNRLIVCADGPWSAFSILCVSGLVPSARLLYRVVRERHERWKKFKSLVSGSWSGFRACIRVNGA